MTVESRETEIQFTNNKDLAPIEYTLIGASAQLRGKLFGESDFLRMLVTAGSVDEDILIPQALAGLSGHKLKNEASRVDKRRRDKGYLSGIMPGLGEDGGVLLAVRFGLVPSIDLPEVDESTGKINPSWRVVLRNEKSDEIVDDDEKLKTLLKSHGLFKDYFEAKFDDGTGVFTLTFQPKKKYSLQHEI
ncbi:MAG: hypothetical protein A3C30_03260 [Candidatus Levybacteria bacterium RIFCSPHIGHO2_02_FULL_40_18]|nr:MAG: hypothetical protein A2869_02020 [Candidatus Levybacteria bacterium RIFCSPHIGHO2_01_FULL_40_58]OGH26109.1 MAG: hypothetical protein A3C30_03260 [Candidatus Levybacteria bacterium RIFCSPHIGHO2_02_FULL_40_18]OGH32090.1 MAG: hypothetical protein A3E43_04120 [Candidatus Levybacteria bacterium RIFCSPHIGHO2_12_FULL_40_31]OGH39930.1 MAG: hypothetical protein A2894_02565 [Candidatus Levybacteria bacterium RIFCSPLOWO2_01_FULL_40_64]OGH49584.1 MAG: hypothetical protein A3I54_05045 [Candidatus Lev